MFILFKDLDIIEATDINPVDQMGLFCFMDSENTFNVVDADTVDGIFLHKDAAISRALYLAWH